jgi:hypothetical protein
MNARQNKTKSKFSETREKASAFIEQLSAKSVFIQTFGNADELEFFKNYPKQASPWAMLALFAGIPALPQVNTAKESGFNRITTLKGLFYNFVDYYSVKAFHPYVNFALSLVFFLAGLIKIPFILLLNLPKIFLEFLPALMLKMIFVELSHTLEKLQKTETFFSIIGQLLLILVLAISVLLIIPFHFWGRSITSPLKSFISPLNHVLAADTSLIARIFHFLLALLSLTSTIATYAVLFPLAAHALVPALASALPAILFSVGAGFMQTFALSASLFNAASAGLGLTVFVSGFMMGSIDMYYKDRQFKSRYPEKDFPALYYEMDEDEEGFALNSRQPVKMLERCSVKTAFAAPLFQEPIETKTTSPAQTEEIVPSFSCNNK